MARLLHLSTGQSLIVRAYHVIGRSRRADLHLDDPRVSSQHAAIRWTRTGWELTDLGSRNGTYLGDQQLESSARASIAVGALIGFGGRDDMWRFDSADPPTAMAEPIAGGQSISAVGDMLALPNDADPQILIYRDAARRWIREDDDADDPIEDGAEITVDGQAWRLYLPEIVAQTEAARPDALDLSKVHIAFSVSRDEEDVTAQVRVGGQTFDMGSRAHHYTTLTLARIRARDQKNPELPITSHGWVHIKELSAMLRIDEKRLNVDIYRARKQLASHGVENAAGIVERKNYRRQLRLGVANITIDVV